MTPTAPPSSSALAPLVDVLLAEPLDQLDVDAPQAQLRTVTPQVGRLQGWLTAAAGQIDELTGGSAPDADTGRPRTVAGWLAEVSHSTTATAGSQLRTARLLRQLPLVTDAVLDGVLTPHKLPVTTKLRNALGKQVGDTVEVHLRERLRRTTAT